MENLTYEQILMTADIVWVYLDSHNRLDLPQSISLLLIAVKELQQIESPEAEMP